MSNYVIIEFFHASYVGVYIIDASLGYEKGVEL